MSYLIDDVARIVATPMPRRQALSLLMRSVIGASAFAALARRTLAQQTDCGSNDPTGCCKCCKNGNCSSGQKCCVSQGANSICCTVSTGYCCCPGTGTCSLSTGTQCGSPCTNL